MTQPYLIHAISHTEIKSHRIWHIWKPVPKIIRIFKSHRIFRSFYIKFCEEININHILLCLLKASNI